MARSIRTHQRRRGFTLIEVMMALSVLVVGLLGVMAMLQTSNRSVAQGLGDTIASERTRMWIEYLKRDALAWNQPVITEFAGGQTSSFAALMPIAQNPRSGTEWIVPPGVTVDAAAGQYMSACSTLIHENVPAGSVPAYCTHVRYTWVIPLELVRIDVRTVSHRPLRGNQADYSVSLTDITAVDTDLAADIPQLRATHASAVVRVHRIN